MRTLLAFFVALAGFIVILGIGITIVTIIDSSTSRGISDMMLGIIMLPSFVLAICAAVFIGVLVIPKRHITFYGDQTMSVPLLNVFQDSKWQIPVATYTVADTDYNLIAVCRKNYIHNIIRKKWECYGPDGEVLAIMREDSLIESLLRRFLGPLFGALRTNFKIYAPDGRTQLGAFNRNFTLFDKYVLDMTMDTGRQLDRRLAAAIGVLLDTGERR